MRLKSYMQFKTVLFSVVRKVPQRVVCNKCSVLLYEGEEIRPPNDVVLDYDGRCPNCGMKLSFVPIDVEIKIIAGS